MLAYTVQTQISSFHVDWMYSVAGTYFVFSSFCSLGKMISFTIPPLLLRHSYPSRGFCLRMVSCYQTFLKCQETVWCISEIESRCNLYNSGFWLYIVLNALLTQIQYSRTFICDSIEPVSKIIPGNNKTLNEFKNVASCFSVNKQSISNPVQVLLIFNDLWVA